MHGFNCKIDNYMNIIKYYYIKILERERERENLKLI